jgi:serine/threonine protein kinase
MVSLHSDSTPEDLIGRELGPYRIVRRLGVGGMAQTFEAVRRGPGDFSQRVCLKVVLPFFQNDPSFAERFKHEARLAAQLHHTNIVGVIDFGEMDGTLYMALQLVDGIDLEALLRSCDRKRLPYPQVALIGREVARALEHAHNPPPGTGGAESIHAIIHRDISPSNVLMSRMGEVLLTDFGVAKALTNKWGKQSNVKGKIPYMSPEQLMGEPVDPRSDLFSLGVVLFEALSGKHPFERCNEPATIMASISGEHVPLGELVPDAPAELCEIIESLLAPDPAKRPQSASDLIELLDPLGSSWAAQRDLGESVAKAAPRVLKEEASGVGPTNGKPIDHRILAAKPSESPPMRPKPGAASASAASAASRPKQARRKVVVWAVLGICGLAAAIYVLWPKTAKAPSAGERAPEATVHSDYAPEQGASRTAGGAPLGSEPSETGVSSEIGPGTPASPKTEGPQVTKPANEAPKTIARRSARLTVIVFPFGDIWINGKSQGAAPMKSRPFKPATYEISAGQGSPATTRTVRLRPGQRERIVFDLTKSEP